MLVSSIVIRILLLYIIPVLGLNNVGVNLGPLGGSNWDPVSPYVFVDLYKHCNPMYIRSVSFSVFEVCNKYLMLY